MYRCNATRAGLCGTTRASDMTSAPRRGRSSRSPRGAGRELERRAAVAVGAESTVLGAATSSTTVRAGSARGAEPALTQGRRLAWGSPSSRRARQRRLRLAGGARAGSARPVVRLRLMRLIRAPFRTTSWRAGPCVGWARRTATAVEKGKRPSQGTGAR